MRETAEKQISFFLEILMLYEVYTVYVTYKVFFKELIFL